MWYKKAKEEWDDSYDDSAPEMEEDADYLNEMDQIDQLETNPLPYDKKDKRQIKKKNELAKSNGKHYYHASPVLFKPGDMITPQETTNFNMSLPGLIYLTNSPVPHYTVTKISYKDKWNVYEVEPLGKVWFGSCWDEYQTDKPCRVVKRIGNAGGLMRSGREPLSESTLEWLKEKIKEAKEATLSPEARAAFKEKWEQEPEQVIKSCQAEIVMGKPKSSKVFSNHLLQGPINTKSNKDKLKVEKGLKNIEGKDSWWYNRPTWSLSKRKLK